MFCVLIYVLAFVFFISFPNIWFNFKFRLCLDITSMHLQAIILRMLGDHSFKCYELRKMAYLISFGSMAWIKNYVTTRIIQAGFIASNLSGFAQHPILEVRLILVWIKTMFLLMAQHFENKEIQFPYVNASWNHCYIEKKHCFLFKLHFSTRTALNFECFSVLRSFWSIHWRWKCGLKILDSAYFQGLCHTVRCFNRKFICIVYKNIFLFVNSLK